MTRSIGQALSDARNEIEQCRYAIVTSGKATSSETEALRHLHGAVTKLADAVSALAKQAATE